MKKTEKKKKETKPSVVPFEKYKKLKKWYAEELKRKDKIIETLERENKLIMNSAIKRATKFDDLNQEISFLREKVSKKRKL